MGIEAATYISQLLATNPVTGDDVSQGDDHLRLLKSVLQTTFPDASKDFYFPKAQTLTANEVAVLADGSTFYLMDATAAARTITLPTLAAGKAGWSFHAMKTDASVNLVTIVGTINGVANFVLSNQYDWVEIVWSGTAWFAFPKRFGIVLSDIPDGAITNAKLAQITGPLFKGRNDATLGNVEDLTPAEATAMLVLLNETGNLKGLVPGPATGDTAKQKLLGPAGWVFAGAPYCLFRETASAGVDAGDLITGAWRTRVLNNTVRNVGGFATLATNQITLTAGSYYVKWSAPAFDVKTHQTRFFNVTDSSVAGVGSSEYNTDSAVQTRSEGSTFFTIAGSKDYELQHRCADSKATFGSGIASGFTTEVYAIVEIWKIG